MKLLTQSNILSFGFALAASGALVGAALGGESPPAWIVKTAEKYGITIKSVQLIFAAESLLGGIIMLSAGLFLLASKRGSKK